VSNLDTLSGKRDLSLRARRTLLAGVAAAAIAALAGGCSTVGTSDVDPAKYDYRLRHPIMLSEEPETFDMKVGMNGPALSPELESAIREYVGDYRADGTGLITIQVPTGTANATAAAETGRAVHYALVRAGVPRSRITVAPYEVGDHANVGTLRLSYLRVKAVVPTCGTWPEGASNRFDNAQLQNFGCATQNNLAAMVANPADFSRPRSMTPADGNRRADVISKYRRGEDPKSNIMLIDSDLGDS
jgi:pilus assembly protein CpaD